MAWAHRVGLVAVLATSFSAAPASAQDPALERAREQIAAASFTEAIATLRQLLSRDDLAASPRNTGLELLAIAQLARRQNDAATETLAELYRRDPDHRLSDPSASPVVQSAFGEARSRRGDPVDVRIEHTPPEAVAPGAPVAIELHVAGVRDAVATVRLASRQDDSEPWASVSLEPDASGTVRTRLVARSTAERIEYYLQALAPSGAALSGLGGEQEPLEIDVTAQGLDAPRRRPASDHESTETTPVDDPGDSEDDESSSGSVFASPWFWTGVGVVAIGAAVVLYILLGPPSEGPQIGDLGSVRLERP